MENPVPWVDASKYQAKRSYSNTDVEFSICCRSEVNRETQEEVPFVPEASEDNMGGLRKNSKNRIIPQLNKSFASSISNRSEIDLKTVPATSRRTLYEKYDTLLDIAQMLETGQINIIKSHFEILKNIEGMSLISYAFTGVCSSVISMKKIDYTKLRDVLIDQKLWNIEIGPCFMERNHMWRYPGRIPIIIRPSQRSEAMDYEKELGFFIPLHVYKIIDPAFDEPKKAEAAFVASCYYTLNGGEYFLFRDQLDVFVKNHRNAETGTLDYKNAMLAIVNSKKKQCTEKLEKYKSMKGQICGGFGDFVEKEMIQLEKDIAMFESDKFYNILISEMLLVENPKKYHVSSSLPDVVKLRLSSGSNEDPVPNKKKTLSRMFSFVTKKRSNSSSSSKDSSPEINKRKNSYETSSSSSDEQQEKSQ